MPITQRNVTLAFLGLLSTGTILFSIYSLATQGLTSITTMAAIAVTVVYTGLFIFYWRGWEYARYVQIILGTLVYVAVQEPYLTKEFSPAIFVPAVIALLMGGPVWIAGSSIGVLAILLWNAKFVGVYANPGSLIIYFMVVGGMFLARLVLDRALRQAEQNALHADDARKQAEQQAEALSLANQQALSQLAEQQRLLDLVATLEIPATQLADGVLFAPLVGHLDTRRAQDFTTRLLENAHSQRARHIVLDIAGVAMVDTAVARALISMVQALRLLGCDVTISGISSDVAITLTHLGVDLHGITTVRNPQEALARVMSRGLN